MFYWLSEFVSKIHDFIYYCFYEVFYIINEDLSETGYLFIHTNDVQFGILDFVIEIIAKFIFILIIALIFYSIYKLIMFIVRRFLNV